jgi:hypothetical protein
VEVVGRGSGEVVGPDAGVVAQLGMELPELGPGARDLFAGGQASELLVELVEDAPAGTADRFAAAHDLTIERASITRFGDDTAAVDLALRDPTADVIVSVMLKQLAAPEPREAWLESATDWDHFRDGDLEVLQAVSERFERTVAVTSTGLHVAVTITPPPRQATLPVHGIDTLALATAALDDPSLTDPARREPG